MAQRERIEGEVAKLPRDKAPSSGRAKKSRRAAHKAERNRMMREVGARLYVTRLALARLEKAPKTQKDFARSVDIPKTSYNQYESGTTMLVPESAVRIYQRYGVALNWLYAGSIDALPAPLYDAIRAVQAELAPRG
jgi:DNA-binding XRE family transcriptional regulator